MLIKNAHTFDLKYNIYNFLQLFDIIFIYFRHSVNLIPNFMSLARIRAEI